MATKTNTNKWSDIQLVIASISITSVIALWNMFAGPDKSKAYEKAEAEQQALLVPTVMPTVTAEPATPAPTMPPKGYKILFGGVAPQPQVIVVNKPAGGGKKANNDDNNNTDGIGGSAPASQPSTSTSSS